MKSTTIENQVVILSFGSSQFVSFVYSRNKTHDENVAPNGSKKYKAKITRKCITEKKQTQKARNFLGGCS